MMQLKAQKVNYTIINFIIVTSIVFFFSKNNQTSYVTVNLLSEEIKHSPPAPSCL